MVFEVSSKQYHIILYNFSVDYVFSVMEFKHFQVHIKTARFTHFLAAHLFPSTFNGLENVKFQGRMVILNIQK